MKSDKMLPAAFKNGDKLRYLGNRQSWNIIDGKNVPLVFHGMEVTIVKTKDPEKGLGIIGMDEENEPIIDYDCDGYNVYSNEHGQERIIWPLGANEWELIK